MGNNASSSSISSKKIIFIQLENEVEAGTVLKGRVYLSIPHDGDDTIRGVNLKFEGEEDTTIVTNEKNDVGKNRRVIDQASCVLYEMEVPLTTFSSSITKGQYEYPFEWPLPANLPSSMAYRVDDGTSCVMKYKMTAYLDRITTTSGAHDDNNFSYSMDINLKAASTLAHPGPMKPSLEHFPITSCCIFPRGLITLGVDVDTAVAAPSGTINVGIMGKNNTTSVKLKYATIRLVESITCYIPLKGRSRNVLTRDLFTTTVTIPATTTTTLWDPRSERSQNKKESSSSSMMSLLFQNNNNNDYDEISQNRFVTQLVLPDDARTSYQGKTMDVSHSLIVDIDTAASHRCVQCITTTLLELTVPIQIKPRMPTFVQQQEEIPSSPVITPTAPTFDNNNQHPTYVMPVTSSSKTVNTVPIAIAELLPNDWNAQKSKVYVISPKDIIKPHELAPKIVTSSSSLEQTAPPEQPSIQTTKIFVQSSNKGISRRKIVPLTTLEPNTSTTNVSLLSSKSSSSVVNGHDPTKREQALSEEEFEKIFHIKRSAFNTLPIWKQKNLKKQYGLF